MPILAALALLLVAQGGRQTPRVKPSSSGLVEASVQALTVSKPTTVDWSYVRSRQAPAFAELVRSAKAGVIPRGSLVGALRDSGWKAKTPSRSTRSTGGFKKIVPFVTLFPVDFTGLSYLEPTIDLGTSSHVYYPYGRYPNENCKVSAHFDGDPGFTVSGITHKVYHEGQYGNPGSYDDNGVPGGDSLSVEGGQLYTINVEYLAKKNEEGQKTATLIVMEGSKEIHVPFKVGTIKSAYSVNVGSLSPAALKLQPFEDGKVAFTLDVKTNVPLNLTVKPMNNVASMKSDDVDLYASKNTTLQGSVRIRITDDSLTSGTFGVMFGVFHEGKMLASFIVPVELWMKWATWNYHLEAGNQTVDGEVLLSSSGLYIWNAKLYNSSSHNPDIFLHSIAFGAPESDGQRWGSLTGGADPIKGASTFAFHQTGRLSSISMDKLMGGTLKSFVSIKGTGILSGFASWFDEIFSPNLVVDLPNGKQMEIRDNMGNESAKWWIDNKVKMLPAGRAWFEF